MKESILLMAVLLLGAATGYGQEKKTNIDYDLSAETAVGTGRHTAYQLVTNRHHVLSTRPNTAYLRGAVTADHALGNDFMLSGAIDMVASVHADHKAYLQQCYGNISWRKFFLEVGSREQRQVLRNERLSIGHFAKGTNAKPIPQVHIGTSDFWTVPYTKGWLQIHFDGGYGKLMDNSYRKEAFRKAPNVNQGYTTGAYYHQKHFYFRSNPEKVVFITAGIEHVALFGGTNYAYTGAWGEGQEMAAKSKPADLKAFWKVILPVGDKNYFEINYAMNRQKDIYPNLMLYNFADNHDVSRLASQLRDSRHLPLVYALLYAMPGIPSVYYGSEFGIKGEKQQGSDANLRPALNIADMHPEDNPLTKFLYRLGAAYALKDALHTGSFNTVEVRNQQLEFRRGEGDDAVYCVLNLSDQPSGMPLPIGGDGWYDLISGEAVPATGGVNVPAFTAMWIAKASPEDLKKLTDDTVTAAAVPETVSAPEPEMPAAVEPPQTVPEEPAKPAEMTAAELVWKLALLDRCMTREKLTEAFGREPLDKQDGSNVVYEYQFDGGVSLRLWGDPVLRAALQYGDRAFEIVL